MAAQLLSGQGFSQVINLSGGINAWDGHTAFFNEERGLEMFSGEESIEKTMVVAYSLEEGLRDFYLTTSGKVASDSARQLFHQLSQIEVKHQEHILEQYAGITGTAVTREEFESKVLPDVLEGGLTTEEYANLLMPDFESTEEIIELAMSIEAQALDLYLRASQRSENKSVRDALIQICEEEKNHLASLGKLMDKVVSGEV